MITPALGQRWVSHAESDLGIGTIVALDERSLSVLFSVSGEVRRYARADAPITRVRFDVDDQILSHEDWSMQVTNIEETDGLLTYHGQRLDTQEAVSLKETFLNHYLQLNKPQDRLFAGQIDRVSHFALRYNTHHYLSRVQKSPTRGLHAPRIDLLGHQLYIGHEVGQRVAPRVLLADEVGLGKTIEAGLILSRQILTGRAQRILILVPENLQHQWLVEMQRRFNISLSLFDELRCQSIQAGQNPFETEQYILCSYDWLHTSALRLEHVCQAQWDILVVDEAHHLAWSQEETSSEYDMVALLTAQIPSVLLLTATPEQLGHEGHFARLHLLDPNRFHDYGQFVAEQKRYEHVRTLAQALLADAPLEPRHRNALQDFLQEENLREDTPEQRRLWLNALLDRTGTSRLLYRNTRKSVGGFKTRLLQLHPLQPVQTSETTEQNVQQKLSPLLNIADGDPRLEWLMDYVKTQKEKTLLICNADQTAIQLEAYLREQEGIRAAVFHSHMSILERDKAAAYFAQHEGGAQILLCSEAGSEGRNFQFSRQLILFDLPLDADQLEQRIGRLDRIGQKHDITLHVPYFEGSAQDVLVRWYNEALNAFTTPCQTALRVFAEFGQELGTLLQQPETSALESLLTRAHTRHQAVLAELASGRNPLLEMHSNNFEVSQKLIKDLEAADQDPNFLIHMFNFFDEVGIDTEDGTDNTLILRPSEHLILTHLPGLTDEGLTATFDRHCALVREDIEYFNIEHPFIRESMAQMIDSTLGTTSVALLKNKALKPGMLMLELVYMIEPNAFPLLHQFLPATPVRLFLDHQGNDYSATVTSEVLEGQLKPVKKHLANKLVQNARTQVQDLIKQSLPLAQAKQAALIEATRQNICATFDAEIERLHALAKVNAAVRSEEIAALDAQKTQLVGVLQNNKLKLDALRMIVTTADV